MVLQGSSKHHHISPKYHRSAVLCMSIVHVGGDTTWWKEESISFKKMFCTESTPLNANVSLCTVVNVVTSHVPWCFSQDIDELNSQLSVMLSQSDSVLTEASTLFFQQKGKAERMLFLTFPTWIKLKSTLFYFYRHCIHSPRQ